MIRGFRLRGDFDGRGSAVESFAVASSLAGDDIDDVLVDVVYVKDLMEWPAGPADARARTFPPSQFVTILDQEGAKLLREMQTDQFRMAVVVDDVHADVDPDS